MKFNHDHNPANHEIIPIYRKVSRFTAKIFDKMKRFFLEERRLLKRKRIVGEMMPPAPFYDELHFASFE